MIKITDEIKLIGATELRTEIPILTKDKNIKTVIITKRGKPVAVLESYQEYKEKHELIETFEDMILGYLAKERAIKTKRNEYIPAEEIMKKINIKA